MLPSPVSQPIHTLDTPALCIDLDTMLHNIHSMSDICRQHGKLWRPHAKGHKLPEVAALQKSAGAIGITVAKLSEAEVFAATGTNDILIANMIVGPTKWERLARLCHSADVIVTCDHYAQVEPLAEFCKKEGVRPRVLVEVNVGMDRVGVRPGADVLHLAQAIDKLKDVRLAGVSGYEGHLLQIEKPDEKQAAITSSLRRLVEARDALLAGGLCCDIVSAAGTGSIHQTARIDGITEIQAGGGTLMDLFYRDRCGVTALRPALTLLATVVSRPALDRAILDAGRKSISPDMLFPEPRDWPDAKTMRLSAEHLELKLGPESQQLQIGDKLELTAGYHDWTVMLHDEVHVIRDKRVAAVWKIAARGCVT